MKANVEIILSEQAKMLMSQMPNVKESDLIDWFLSNGPIAIGGGRVIEYIEWRKNR